MTKTSERVDDVSPHFTDSVLIYQLGLPHYRQAMLDILAESSPNVRFLVGDGQFMDFVTTEVTGSNVVSTGPNVFMLGRRLAWQRIDLRAALAAKLVVLEMNPRILNTWLVLGLRRLLRRPTIGWGHVFGRRGPASKSERIRGWMRSLFNGMIVYTESERRSFLRGHPGKACWVAANAIYKRQEMVPASSEGTRSDFLCIGRLVREKRPELALEAFRVFAAQYPEAGLTYVGAGPEQVALEMDIERMGLSGRVRVLGHLTDWATLQQEFARAVATVCSGYAGLNVTQSLGFGVPVIYAPGEPNAPEVEALNEGNSVQFMAEDPQSLAGAMRCTWLSKQTWQSKAPGISADTRQRYSAEAMASAFEEASRYSARLPKRNRASSRGSSEEK